jgi:hypothetical protein
MIVPEILLSLEPITYLYIETNTSTHTEALYTHYNSFHVKKIKSM